MGKLLITQSLISSWNYLHNCYDGCEEDAYNEFLDTLNRVPKETTPEMQNGIDFENLVYSIAGGTFHLTKVPTGETARAMGDTVIFEKTEYPKWFNGANAVATVIRGAQTQVKAQRELTIGDTELLVYGILDALKAGSIYDVKFSNKGFSSADLAGKYLDSPQHPAYFFIVPEAYDFTYLVSDGEDLYTERYTRKEARPFPEIAKEFLDSLAAMKLLDVYKEKWAVK